MTSTRDPSDSIPRAMEGPRNTLKFSMMTNILLTVLTVLLHHMSTHISAGSYVPTQFIRKKILNLADVPNSEYYPKMVNVTPSFYKILDIHSDHGEGGHIFIGGRNTLTELHQVDLSLAKEMHVPSIPVQGDLTCEQLQAKDSDYYCQNYVTFVQEVNDTTSILCGTNALFPRCVTFLSGESDLNDSIRWDAVGLTASGPDQDTVTYAVNQGEDLMVYSGAPTKRQYEFAFSRNIIGPNGEKKDTVQTDTTNKDWIEVSEAPSFIGRPIDYNGKMYFFFREEAVEARNVEKVIYSRVAQVCQNDVGGTEGTLKGKWTTFLKARLSCATQGSIKMYFDNLRSIFRSNDDSNITFGVFTTPDSSIPASALCAFDLAEIEKLFEESPFKRQETSNSLWLNVPADDVPSPRPGTCTETMPTDNYQALMSIQLMSSLVPNKADYSTPREWSYPMDSDNPALILLGHRLQQVVVQEMSTTGLDYDIFFFGTDKGQIMKAYIYEGKPRIIDEVVLTVNNSAEEAINVLKIIEDGSTLFASTSSRVYRLPTDNCGRFKTCVECVAGMDPACSWMAEGCEKSAVGIRDLANADTSACPVASSTTSRTMPATPASESTAEPAGLTTDMPNESTPKEGQPQTGTAFTEVTGTTLPPPPPPTTTSTNTPSRKTLTPPPPQQPTTESQQCNLTMESPCDCSLLVPVEQKQADLCTNWVTAFAILVCICIFLIICITVYWVRRRKTYMTSSPLKKNRFASQKVPLKAVNGHNSEEEDEPDETAPMHDTTGNNITPHKDTVVHFPIKKNNGQTPTVKTPVRGATTDSSNV